MNLKLALASLAALSLTLTGCAADPTEASDDAEDTGLSHDELTALAAPFVGDYAWRAADSAYLDIAQIKLDATGAYTARVDASYVDPGVRCVAFPCTLPESGTWQAYRSFGKTKLRLRPAGHPSRSYYASVANGTLTLTRSGQTTKLFAQPALTCANVRCAAGTHCEMRGINGGVVPVCLQDAPPPLQACRKTGCSGQICADRDMMTTCEFRPEYGCYHAATCERQADGQCGFTATPALSACLAQFP